MRGASMLQKIKVSIIVPIYKVEKYIHRCVDSIIHQTYSNLEIILVNDGSPDNCGKMADHYRALDERIKVIHKQNGGLSDARNKGMELATGEFTMFVDSDDWLDEKMVETMVNQAVTFQADIVQTAFYYAYDDQLLIDNRYYTERDPSVLLNNKALMCELVKNEKVKNFAWGKLYKTKLIKNIPFKKGVLFEDVFWAHQVMHQVDTYLILHEPLFYYYQRHDSIVTTYSPRSLDMIKGLKERHHFIEQFYEELMDESYKIILKTCLIHYHLLVMNRKNDRSGSYRRKIASYIRENNRAFKHAVKDDRQLKRQLFLFSLHPYMNIGFLGGRKALRKIGVLAQPRGLKRVSI